MENCKGKGIVDYNESESEDVVESNDVPHDNGDNIREEEEEEDAAFTLVSSDAGKDKAVDLSKLSYDEIMAKEFNSLEEAEMFYYEYARHSGFCPRKRSLKKTSSGLVRLRIFVCQKEGKRSDIWNSLRKRKRQPKLDIRQECPALFQVTYDVGRGVWVVRKFVKEHNHELVPPKHARFLTTNRRIDESIKGKIEVLRASGVDTRRIIDLMTMQSRGYDKMGFVHQDLHNNVFVQRGLELPSSDVKGVLSFFDAKQSNDPGFYFNNTFIHDSRMGNLFWADSMSRFDYSFFGDVIAFDLIYKKNKYNRPLVIIIGLNHHHQSIIFATAILVDETMGNYVWMLNELINCMGSKTPLSVVTDGDLSMGSAIREVLPEAAHRLCSFHVLRNAAYKVPNPKFKSDFSDLMFKRMNENDFVNEWSKLVSNHNVEENEWVVSMYEQRSMWSGAFLKSKFFGGTRTTSRCEKMHSFLDKFTKKKLAFSHFVKHHELILDRIREEEARFDHNSRYGVIQCNHPLHHLERHAAEVYTRASFKIFQEQLNQVVAYKKFADPVLVGSKHSYFVSRYDTKGSFCTVMFNVDNRKMWCSCQMFESIGFPCGHLLYVMKKKSLESIPESCILARWTKNAKAGTGNDDVMSNDTLCKIRYGMLCTTFRPLCELASKSEETFNIVYNEIVRLRNWLMQQENLSDDFLRRSESGSIDDANVPKKRQQMDMEEKSSQGRRCSLCKQLGHTKSKCPQLVISMCPTPTYNECMLPTCNGGPTPHEVPARVEQRQNITSSFSTSMMVSDNRSDYIYEHGVSDRTLPSTQWSHMN